MIAHINGKLVELNPAYAVIECNGVGYYLNISLNTYSRLGESESCKLFTHLSVKEDSHTLYGFYEKLERKIFRMLISVSGVGASTARVILSSMQSSEIRDAIVSEDIALIKSVKGIGVKTAQRIQFPSSEYSKIYVDLPFYCSTHYNKKQLKIIYQYMTCHTIV